MTACKDQLACSYGHNLLASQASSDLLQSQIAVPRLPSQHHPTAGETAGMSHTSCDGYGMGPADLCLTLVESYVAETIALCSPCTWSYRKKGV